MFEDSITAETTETIPSEVETAETGNDNAFLEALTGEEETTEETAEEETEEAEELEEDDRGDDDRAQDEEKEEIPASFTLKVNGSEVQVSQEEIIPLAQKGMDYDRIRQQRDQLMNDKAIRQLDELAQLQGMDRENFIGFLMGSFRQNQISQLAYQLVNEKGLDEQTAYEMAALQVENQSILNNQSLQRQREERLQREQQELMARQNSEQQRMADSFAALYNAFPELGEKTFDDLPDSVKQAIISGQSPLEAYQAFVIGENKKQLEIMRNNTKVKEKKTGSTQSVKRAEQDDFLSTFLS